MNHRHLILAYLVTWLLQLGYLVRFSSVGVACADSFFLQSQLVCILIPVNGPDREAQSRGTPITPFPCCNDSFRYLIWSAAEPL